MSRPVSIAAVGCLTALLLSNSSCSGNAGVPSGSADLSRPLTPDGRPLRPIALPDLSQMAAPVQQQIREAHDAVVRITGTRGATTTDLSAAYGGLGKLFMAAQIADAAEPCFLNAQTLDSSDYRWPYYLAQLYRSRGELDQARALFERTRQLRPSDVATLVWLGDVYLSSGLPAAAGPVLEQALALDPRSASARYGLGRTALANNNARKAVDYLEEVLTLDPAAGDAHYPLSLAYTALGDKAKADEHLRLRRNRKIEPADPLMRELDSLLQSPQTYETQGIAALNIQRWEEAAAQFRKGLAIDPRSAALRFRLATAINMMGDTIGAEALFSEVVRDTPDYFPAQFSLGVILQAKGLHGQAAERFTAALVQRPDYAEARLRLASTLRRIGRTEESLSNYQQVLTANPDLVEARIGYAMTLVQAKRDLEAREVLAEGMTLHKDEVAFSHGLARLLAAAPDNAVRDGRMAMGLVQQLVAKGRTPDLGETMAMALAELGEFERAAAIQRDLIRGAKSAGIAAVEARLTRNLQLYQARRPCRTPWTDEEMP